MDRMHEIALKMPANQEDALMARMAVSGLGMLAGLDADTIGDLQTVVNECTDCLLNQVVQPETISMTGWVENNRLILRWEVEGNQGQNQQKPLDNEVVRCILETLMPQVELESDQRGVHSILCSIAV
ncbi:MAG: hypothetical protein E7331_07410 [Clostridiales bacterium]|nr:hypothetical protein [Clostridiales bacterium]